MAALNRHQLETLNHIRVSPLGQALLAILHQRLAEYDAALRREKDADIYRAQGKAQALDDLITEIEKSHEQLQRQVPRPKEQL